MPAKTKGHGLLYEQAAGFAKDLETSQTAAVDQMLAAWTDSYWGVRKELDTFLAKVEAAKIAGTPVSPAWAFQQQRLKNLLDETKTQIARYAADASQVTEKAQAAAIAAALKHSEKLAGTAIAQSLPGFTADLARINPKVLESGVGFLADGSVLRNHLALTMPSQAATKVQEALIHGLATGKSQAWMTRAATEALGLSHTRATTILRTESLRAYRHASRATYMANADVMEGWVWNAHLDSRTCVACALMDGTVHAPDATLDGHPRCRCAMVPRTKSWEDLGVQGIADTRPPIRSGKEWLESQSPSVQLALMGRSKFDAWNAGQIGLDDMVGRTYSPQWGTMRGERSLKAILEDRNANWFDTSATPVNVGPTPPPAPQMGYVKELAARHDLDYLKAWKDTPGNGPQALANIDAAIELKVRQLETPKFVRAVADQAKVESATAKLEKAVLEKGYPSKGYSQTQAIYKAQANGVVGQPVGVIKSLTWEQKVTAQAILEEHNAALPSLIRKWEKAKALEAAHGEAIALNLAKDAQAAADEAVAALKKELNSLDFQHIGDHEWRTAMDLKKLDLEDSLKAAGEDVVAKAKAEASLNQWAAHKQAYDDAQDTIQANGWGGTSWKAGEGTGNSFIELDEHGWATITNADNTITIQLQPMHVPQTLNGPNGWEQVLTPEPDQVKAWTNVYTVNGQIDNVAYTNLKKELDSATSMLTAQQKADLKAALDEGWVSGKWTPEPEYVAKIKADLASGKTDVDDLRFVMDATDKPLTKANLSQAIKEWQAEQIAKASIPVPKPAIDVAKIKWEKVSDAQVAKLVAKVESGQGTVDDLYAAFQASKNAGPKANYAKAILKLEGKADAIPGALSEEAQHLAALWEKDLKAGNIDAQELQDLVHASYSTANDKAAAQYVLDKEAAAAAHTPPVTKITTPATDAPAWPSKPPWEPSALKDTGQVLGTHGARVYEAPDGTRWLFKPPKDAKDAFLTTLDEATARFQARVGLKAPDTYTVTLGGKRGSIQRMFPATDGFPSGFNPTALTKADLDVVQREHALDWLLSNHDGHRDQFLRLEDGTMVGIDKGQSFRWFGQDKLDWNFHPNQAYGAPEPVYNALWRDFAAGKDVDLDPPGQGALWDQIKQLQAIPDDELRDAFREYAEQAAQRGLLAKRQSYPGLTPSAKLENDVEAFLDALVERKNNLDKDFQALWDKAVAERQKALPGWKPKTPTVAKGKLKWVGKDKPALPEPPVPPGAATEGLFTDWVDSAKARLKAFNGKDLETSNNWARFRKVIEDLDEGAAKELLDRNYLRPEDYQEALDLIAKAKAERVRLEGEFRQAKAAHDKLVKAYKKDLADWKDANGIQDLTQGMDEGVVRHGTDPAGLKWAEKKWDGTVYTGSERQWLRDYTGSYYDSLNAHLRSTKGKVGASFKEAAKHIDSAMGHIPVPEDVIVHRGVGAARYGEHQFDLAGVGFKETDDLTKLIGSVQVDHGYISTSVGNTAAFSSNPIQLKIRVPQGTPASLVTSFSNYGTAERELILGRGQRMYVHNAYKQNGKWFLEVEIVPADFDPTAAIPTPSAKPWKV